MALCWLDLFTEHEPDLSKQNNSRSAPAFRTSQLNRKEREHLPKAQPGSILSCATILPVKKGTTGMRTRNDYPMTRITLVRFILLSTLLLFFGGLAATAMLSGAAGAEPVPGPSALADAPMSGQTTVLPPAPELAISAPVASGEPGLQGSPMAQGPERVTSDNSHLPWQPGQVLYDQTDNPGTNAVTSQNFEIEYDAYDAQAADDFEVPAGETWTIDTVEVAGRYDRGTGPADSVNVFIYQDSGSLPATPVFTQTANFYSPGPNQGDFIIPLDAPVTLQEGRYWLSVQANLDYMGGGGGQWFWRERWVRSFTEAAWRNPGGGFRTPGSCLEWGPRASTCFREIPAPQRDQVFRLSGISGLTPTPTNTVTGTPPTSSPTRTPRATTPTATPTGTVTVMVPPPVGTPQPPIPPTETQTPSRTPTYTPTPVPPCGLFWRIVPSENAAAPETSLAAVGALAPDDVWAVGYYRPGEWHRTFTEHWDGTRWTVIASPNANDYDNQLYGVLMVAPYDVWAVGDYWRPDAGIGSALIFHWNGAEWSIVPNPVENQSSILKSVSVIPSSGAWAVGTVNAQTLTLRLVGGQWVIVPSPNIENAQNFLESVSASSDDNALAVGSYYDPVYNQSGYLAMRWDGTQWSIMGQGFMAWLSGVTAVSPNEGWAAGYGYVANGFAPLIMKWNGSSWMGFQTGVTSGIARLSSVSAAGTGDVWAVGYYTDLGGSLYDYPLVIHCDGSQCAQVESPNPGDSSSRLLSIDALTASDIWSAGHSIDAAGYGTTMVQRYYDPCAIPPSTSTPTPTGVATSSATITAGASATASATALATRTITPVHTATHIPPARSVTPTGTASPCPMNFSDVHLTDYFYEPVRYLYCGGAISGYSDGTFRPYNNTTRGQLSKIAVLAEGWTIDTSAGPHFSDVPPSNPFYAYIETAYNHSAIIGYSDGTFRWGNNVTRAQLSKIVVVALGWAPDTTGGPHFLDVQPDNPFYAYVETAYNHSIISGYSDGTFRPGNNATRGQIAKILYSALTLSWP